jgi:hypothetical protein
VSVANLSTTFFLNGLCLHGQPELASPKARLATEGDWLLKIRCALFRAVFVEIKP